MNLADQMKADINFNKIVSKLQREFPKTILLFH